MCQPLHRQESIAAAKARYLKTPKGKAMMKKAVAKYGKEKVNAAVRRYRATPKGSYTNYIVNKRYHQTPAWKAYHKHIQQTDPKAQIGYIARQYIRYFLWECLMDQLIHIEPGTYHQTFILALISESSSKSKSTMPFIDGKEKIVREATRT